MYRVVIFIPYMSSALFTGCGGAGGSGGGGCCGADGSAQVPPPPMELYTAGCDANLC